MPPTLAESETGVIWLKGCCYVYRRPYADERAASNGFVVVEFGSGKLVDQGAEMIALVSEDVARQAQKVKR